jgi:hypothetical protein
MSLVEGLTIGGLFGGPVAAVIITLCAERARELKLRRLNAVRLLLVGRLNFADINFQQAINTIPVDFAGHDRVLAALEAYYAAVAIQQPAGDEAAARAVTDRWNQALENLATALLASIGYSERGAAQFARSGYVSKASSDMRQLQIDVLRAVTDVAANTGRLATANEQMLERLGAASVPNSDSSAPKSGQ